MALHNWLLGVVCSTLSIEKATYTLVCTLTIITISSETFIDKMQQLQPALKTKEAPDVDVPIVMRLHISRFHAFNCTKYANYALPHEALADCDKT